MQASNFNHFTGKKSKAGKGRKKKARTKRSHTNKYGKFARERST